jgi:DNA-binding NarL/FixJ family response regulator
MTEEEFGKAYLTNMDSIKKSLENLEIYDKDLLHDTYIALYEYAEQKHWIRNFKNTFIGFYWKRFLRLEEHEAHYDAYDDEQMYNMDVPDESDLEYREQVGRRVDKLIRYYAEHPQPGERNHQQSVKILRLYCRGYNECEISHKLEISQQAVNQSLKRIIERLKVVAKWL